MGIWGKIVKAIDAVNENAIEIYYDIEQLFLKGIHLMSIYRKNNFPVVYSYEK